jgi:hypothetical protein
MKSNFDDYLKYWRVIRQYIKARYELSQADLDMLLFLYSEGYFGKDKFREFAQLVSWDVNRFDRLLTQGWIENFRADDWLHLQEAVGSGDTDERCQQPYVCPECKVHR